GVTFGPRNERNYKKKINKKERRKALFMGLSGKADSDLVVVIDDLSINKPKTKELSFLKDLPCNDGSILIAAEGSDENLLLAARNLPDVTVMEARNLNALDLLSYKYLVLPEASLKVIKDTFL
ncbi:MAG: 50S ribosomal protein L4, partial [Patescibacteria group bacterium]